MTKTELKTTIERIVEKKVKLEVKKQLSETRLLMVIGKLLVVKEKFLILIIWLIC